jgi:hypothetical protein
MRLERCGLDQQMFGVAEQGRSRSQTYLSDVRPSIHGEDNASSHFSHTGSQTALAVAARASPFGEDDDFRRQGFADPPTPRRDRAEAGRHARRAARVGNPHRHRLFGPSGKPSKERLKPLLSRLEASAHRKASCKFLLNYENHPRGPLRRAAPPSPALMLRSRASSAASRSMRARAAPSFETAPWRVGRRA